MIAELTNFNGAATQALPVFVGETHLVKTKPSSVRSLSNGVRALISKPVFAVETCTRIELSLVPEIERVFFEREGDKEFRVISVVNQRDAAIRDKVYAREEAIMETYPGLNFDFHVVARMDRKIEDVITKTGKVAFER
jgi:hypothetical protein